MSERQDIVEGKKFEMSFESYNTAGEPSYDRALLRDALKRVESFIAKNIKPPYRCIFVVERIDPRETDHVHGPLT